MMGGEVAMSSNVWQMVAAAAAVAAVWFAARHDSRQARAEVRTEFQQSIENAITPRLDSLANSVAAVRTDLRAELDKLDSRLGRVEADVSALKADVAYLRGRQESRSADRDGAA